MRIAITADLHWGHNRLGDDATAQMLEHLRQQPPDVLLLGGDIGTNEQFETCLQLFSDLPCLKAVVPGNHDLWVASEDPRGDSLNVYRHHLPRVCAAHHYHYLSDGPLILSQANLAIAGSINWYDYSWSIERMKEEIPNWQWHLDHKAFTRGRHNDGRFICWPTDDVTFTRDVVEVLARQIAEATSQVEKLVVLTHHPALRAISFPQPEPVQGLDALLWQALSGNSALERVLQQYAPQLALVASGHTHRAVETKMGAVPAYNIGGDYHFKRLLTFQWPAGEIEALVFGNPDKPPRRGV